MNRRRRALRVFWQNKPRWVLLFAVTLTVPYYFLKACWVGVSEEFLPEMTEMYVSLWNIDKEDP